MALKAPFELWLAEVKKFLGEVGVTEEEISDDYPFRQAWGEYGMSTEDAVIDYHLWIATRDFDQLTKVESK